MVVNQRREIEFSCFSSDAVTEGVSAGNGVCFSSLCEALSTASVALSVKIMISDVLEPVPMPISDPSVVFLRY